MKQPLTVAELTGAKTSKPLSEAQWEIVRQQVRVISRDLVDWECRMILAFIDLQMKDHKIKIKLVDMYLEGLWRSYIESTCTLVSRNKAGAYYRVRDDFEFDKVDRKTSELFPLSRYLRECLADNAIAGVDCQQIMNQRLDINFLKPEDPVRQTLSLIINIENLSMEERLAQMADVLDQNGYFFYPFVDDLKLEQCLNDMTDDDLKQFIHFNRAHVD